MRAAGGQFQGSRSRTGPLNLSRGGGYPVEYALRLGAGFGSQDQHDADAASAEGPARGPVRMRVGIQPSRIADPVHGARGLTGVAGHPRRSGSGASHAARAGSRSGAPAKLCGRRRRRAKPQPVVETKWRRHRRRRLRSTRRHASSPARPAVGGDPVKDRILALVAEKTGYPSDMLDLDLDLEADLGVDTVKQADLFASVREAYNIARRQGQAARLPHHGACDPVRARSASGPVQTRRCARNVPASSPQPPRHAA
jgi:hypothetical protein